MVYGRGVGRVVDLVDGDVNSTNHSRCDILVPCIMVCTQERPYSGRK